MGGVHPVAELVVVDTDILIDVSRGVLQAIDSLNTLEAQSEVVISVITQMELIVGCQNKQELHQLERFLQRFRIVPLNNEISIKGTELLIQYRLSHGLLIPDGLIAATAITLNATLASKHQKDYRFIPELHLLPYPIGS